MLNADAFTYQCLRLDKQANSSKNTFTFWKQHQKPTTHYDNNTYLTQTSLQNNIFFAHVFVIKLSSSLLRSHQTSSEKLSHYLWLLVHVSGCLVRWWWWWCLLNFLDTFSYLHLIINLTWVSHSPKQVLGWWLTEVIFHLSILNYSMDSQVSIRLGWTCPVKCVGSSSRHVWYKILSI